MDSIVKAWAFEDSGVGELGLGLAAEAVELGEEGEDLVFFFGKVFKQDLPGGEAAVDGDESDLGGAVGLEVGVFFIGSEGFFG